MSLTDYFSLSRNNAVIGSAAGINAEGVRKLSPGWRLGETLGRNIKHGPL
jgi:hypothetical protein